MITAKEANALATEVRNQKHQHIFKQIKAAADEGNFSIAINVRETLSVRKVLKDAGFNISAFRQINERDGTSYATVVSW
jgi:hypothetical protein